MPSSAEGMLFPAVGAILSREGGGAVLSRTVIWLRVQSLLEVTFLLNLFCCNTIPGTVVRMIYFRINSIGMFCRLNFKPETFVFAVVLFESVVLVEVSIQSLSGRWLIGLLSPECVKPDYSLTAWPHNRLLSSIALPMYTESNLVFW